VTKLHLTGDDMADLLAGNSINAMAQDGQEFLTTADRPEGAVTAWVPTVESIAEFKHLAEIAYDAAESDSNDEEIGALHDALTAACAALDVTFEDDGR